MSPVSVEPIKPEESSAAEDSGAAAPPQIQYEAATAPISRRQFRLVFLLTIANSLMLFLFVAGPVISRTLSGWQADYKKWQADRLVAQQKAQALQKSAANFQAAMQYAAPENEVIYEEDAARAAALLAKSSDYSAIHCSGFIFMTPSPWQLPVIRNSSAMPPPFQTSSAATAFLHSLKTPDGVQRLVFVALIANTSFVNDSRGRTVRNISIYNQRQLSAVAFYARADGTLASGTRRKLDIDQPNPKCTTVQWTVGKDDRWESGRITSNVQYVFRFFAGQADPKDPSHFTIPYELDGQPNLIDGWLLSDQTVALEPRQGRTTFKDSTALTRLWDPYAIAPATRPMTPPKLPPAGSPSE